MINRESDNDELLEAHSQLKLINMLSIGADIGFHFILSEHYNKQGYDVLDSGADANNIANDLLKEGGFITLNSIVESISKNASKIIYALGIVVDIVNKVSDEEKLRNKANHEKLLFKFMKEIGIPNKANSEKLLKAQIGYAELLYKISIKDNVSKENIKTYWKLIETILKTRSLLEKWK